MKFVSRIKEKIVGKAPAIIGLAMTAGVVGSVALGGASATDTNTTAVVKYYGLSTMQWIMAIMALIFGGATVFLRDFRTAIIAVVCVIGAIVVGFFGI